ncbi:MAG: helix-hairpin-helix domain-containing protein [Actinomycetota bacterium]|nr:helix-hairpin-helix domain-containing protein [Actinomycetota bacterium]
MRSDAFETATRGPAARRKAQTGTFARYGPQAIVAMLVMIVLAGGAFYTARISEGTPRVVYTASLEEVEDESQDPLTVNINTADVEELDELPEVGPATAQSIIEYRQTNGPFSSVDELEEISGIGPETLEKIAPFATV